jgi:hypothetical protein
VIERMTYWVLGPIASFQSGSFGAMDQKRNLCRPELMRYASNRERWVTRSLLSVEQQLASDR